MLHRTPRSLKIAMVANASWHLYNYRGEVMNALRAAGHEVVAVAPQDAYSEKLVEAGYAYRPIPLDATGISPLRELRCIAALRRVLREEKVDAVLSFTPKGNIHSGLAINEPSVIFIANISGLGRAFSEGSGIRWAAKMSFKRALARANSVLFQNDDDLRALVAQGIVCNSKALRVPGSGVDLTRFKRDLSEPTHDAGATVFLLVSRLLQEKGVTQYVAAARQIRTRIPNIRFQILGPFESGRAGISREIMDAWVREGAVEYLGVTDDVRVPMTAADCIVLPSYYREGVPRSLLEAASLGKPVIATDVSGCRDALEDGVTGYLCRPQDIDDLVATLEKFIALPQGARDEMGRLGREKMQAEFDETIVIDRYLNLLSKVSS